MAEFCLECLNRIHGTDFKENEVALQDDLCEECGEIKPCVVSIGNAGTGIFRRLLAFLQKSAESREYSWLLLPWLCRFVVVIVAQICYSNLNNFIGRL